KINIKLNVNHPFYIYVIKPLCNTVEDENDPEAINRDSKLKDAIVMIFMSYSKSESMFGNHEDLFLSLRSQWATYLSTVVKEAYERG
ncbi:MAG: hypothetical protein K6B14_10060, partial [Lachnospiraceae bacterium]|nr:hypothetical protein [Lachnospiraceae bacterium]